MKLFVANWKMHKTRAEARAFAADLGARDRKRHRGPRARRRAAVDRARRRARSEQGRWALACQNVAAEARRRVHRRGLGGDGRGRRLPVCDRRTLGAAAALRRRRGDARRRRSRGAARRASRPSTASARSAEQRDAGLTEATLAAQISTLSRRPRRRAARPRLRAHLGDRDGPRRDAAGLRRGLRTGRDSCCRAEASCGSSTAARSGPRTPRSSRRRPG